MQWLFVISDFALEACNYLILKWIQLLSCKMTEQRSVAVDWSSWGCIYPMHIIESFGYPRHV